MGVPKMRYMVTNKDGTKDQVYMITHVDAVEGLKETLDEKGVNIGVTSINGQTGDVQMPVLDQRMLARMMTVVEAYENGELTGGNGNITIEKVEE